MDAFEYGMLVWASQLQIPAHIGGAVNDIVCAGVNDMKSGALITTSGAVKKSLLDPRSGFRPMYTLEHHKTLYIR